jgi:hypothetical protein
MADDRVHLGVSPDFDRQLEELRLAADVLDAAGMLEDPETQALLDRLCAIMRGDDWVAWEKSPDGTVMISCGDDRLLDIFAKFQALRSVGSARLKGRRA